MYCQRHRSINYRFISVMFWAFPYLLWQVFGNVSGFAVGVVLAAVLTVMFNSLFQRGREMRASVDQQSVRVPERQSRLQEEVYQPYQSGYQGEMEPYRGEQAPLPMEQLQPQYEEMQVPYPQEMPPLEQWKK